MSPRALSPYLPAAGIGLALLALVLGGELGGWFATALLLGLAPQALARLRVLRATKTPPGKLASVPAELWVGVIFALVVFAPLWQGHPPASRDHGIHYFQTHLMAHEFLPQGKLWGWSQSVNAGFPYGENYPVLAYLFGALPHLLSAEWIDLRSSYAWVFGLTWLAGAGAVASLSLRLARKLELKRPPLAALLTVLAFGWDLGASRQGGWAYVVFHGVWPQFLSTVLWLWAWVACLRVKEMASPRRIALAGGALGASILAHPFGLIAAALLFVVLMLEPASEPDSETKARPGHRPQRRALALSFALAAAGSAGWVHSFLSATGAMKRSPVPWEELGPLSGRLLQGELFHGLAAPVSAFAFLGAVLAWRARGSLGRSLVLCFLGFLLLASEASVAVLELDALVPAWRNLQFPRFAFLLKPLLQIFAGVGLAWAVQGLGATGRSAQESPERSTQLLLLALLAPFVFALARSPDAGAPRPFGDFSELEGSEHEAYERELRELLKSEAPSKVAFLRLKMSGATYPLFALADLRVPIVLDGHIPAMNFKHLVHDRSARSLRELGVSHVVYDGRLDSQIAHAATLVGEAGPWKVSRMEPTGQTNTAPFPVKELEGPPEHWVKSGLAPYRKWVAEGPAGEELPTRFRRRKHRNPKLEVRLGSEGRAKMIYRTPTAERASAWLSALAWLALALACLRRQPLPLGPAAPRAARWSRSLAFALPLLALAVAQLRAEGRAEDAWNRLVDERATWPEGTQPAGAGSNWTDLVREQEVRRVYASGESREHCDGRTGRWDQTGCRESAARGRRAWTDLHQRLFRCERFEIAPGKQAHFRLGSQALEGAAGKADLFGFVVREHGNKGGHKIRLSLNEASAGTLRRRRQYFKWLGAHEGAMLSIRNGTDQAESVCIAAAARF